MTARWRRPAITSPQGAGQVVTRAGRQTQHAHHLRNLQLFKTLGPVLDGRQFRAGLLGVRAPAASCQVVLTDTVAGASSVGFCGAQSVHEAFGVDPRQYRQPGCAAATGCTRKGRGAEAGCVLRCHLGKPDRDRAPGHEALARLRRVRRRRRGVAHRPPRPLPDRRPTVPTLPPGARRQTSARPTNFATAPTDESRRIRLSANPRPGTSNTDIQFSCA